jgi:hypothetical protein
MGTRKGLGCKLRGFVSGNILYCTISPFESLFCSECIIPTATILLVDILGPAWKK